MHYSIPIQKLLEKIDDASTELMMGNGERVMLRLGEAMFEATEDEATEFCEAEVERNQEILDKLNEEEADILKRQDALKKSLYGRCKFVGYYYVFAYYARCYVGMHLLIHIFHYQIL